MDDGEEFLLEWLRRAVKVHAPSWCEGPVRDLLRELLDVDGVTVREDPVGNLIAKTGSGSPLVLLASHMDTIDVPLEYSEDGDWIRGRGAVDCRASLVAMALATRRLAARLVSPGGRRGTVVFAGIVAEETDTAGVDTLVKEDLAGDGRVPDYIIFGEPTNHKICIAYKGRVWVELVATTEPGHVAAAWLYPNLIEEVFRFYQLLGDGLQRLVNEKTLSPFYTPRATMTTIRSEGVANMLPSRVVADIDIRFPPGIQSTAIVHLVDETIKHCLEGETVNGVDGVGTSARGAGHARPAPGSWSMTRAVKSRIDGIRVGTRNPLCGELARAIERVLGERPRFVKKTGTTFMNQLGARFGCPIVTYGPGDPVLEHTSDERVKKQDFLAAILVLEETVRGLLDLQADHREDSD